MTILTKHGPQNRIKGMVGSGKYGLSDYLSGYSRSKVSKVSKVMHMELERCAYHPKTMICVSHNVSPTFKLLK